MSQQQAEDDTVAMPFPPTAGFIAALVGALLAESLWPTTTAPGLLRFAIGLAVIGAGFAIVITALLAFRAHEADPDPRAPVPRILTDGVYRFSRNPIYIAFIAFPIGLGICWSSAWMLAAAVPLWVFLDRVVIAREEAYLEARFPVSYASYRRVVPRWL
jgi:protein-S-isoprenylcysteine O-methyltransferase Ste14